MHATWSVVVGLIGAACGPCIGVMAHEQDPSEPTVPIVQAIGCAEGDGRTWFLTRASDPAETLAPFASTDEIAAAQQVPLGSNRFQLIGVAEFLDIEGLLDEFDRSDFTARESVNATGQLSGGRKLLVKGLHLQDSDPQRINLTSVTSLADPCPEE